MREALLEHRIRLRDFHWLGDNAVDDIGEEGLAVWARVRSTRPPAPARLLWSDGQADVVLLNGEMGVAPGQACVLYESEAQDSRVLGGGTIMARAAARGHADAA